MREKEAIRVYLAWPNLMSLCAVFMLSFAVHSYFIVPYVVNRTQRQIDEALSSSVQNQNRVGSDISERLDKIEALIKKQ